VVVTTGYSPTSLRDVGSGAEGDMGFQPVRGAGVPPVQLWCWHFCEWNCYDYLEPIRRPFRTQLSCGVNNPVVVTTGSPLRGQTKN
jgi:hypothetical protein